MVKRASKLPVFVGIILLNLTAFSQSNDELKFIISHNSAISGSRVKQSSIFKNETSELKIAFLGIVRFYQLFISPQDMPTCNFTVNCSSFALSAIKKFGIFHGLLIASDRVQRCNGVGRRYYPLDLQTGLSIDYPLEDYFMGIRKRKDE